MNGLDYPPPEVLENDGFSCDAYGLAENMLLLGEVSVLNGFVVSEAFLNRDMGLFFYY